MGITKDQWANLVKGLKAVYTSERFVADRESFLIWYEMLKDLEYPVLNEVIKAHIMTNKFPPTIADIREGVAKLTAPEELTAMEAWNRYVRPAISDGNYHAQERYDAMPEDVKKALGSAGAIREWANDTNFNDGVAMSQFAKSYAIIQERMRFDARVPVGMRLENRVERTAIGENHKEAEST